MTLSRAHTFAASRVASSRGVPGLPSDRAAAAREIVSLLSQASDVVLTTHVNPDADGLGAEAGLAAWLRGKGVPVRILNPDPAPRTFAFLEEAGTPFAVFRDGVSDRLSDADVIVVLDAPVGARVGPLAAWLPGLRARIVRIDHHVGAERGTELALVDPAVSSTAELVVRMLAVAGEDLPPAAAAPLYAGIAFDTGSFRYGNTTRETHLVAAELHRLGVRPERVNARMGASHSLARMHAWGRALASMRLEADGRLAWMAVDRATLAAAGARPEDLEGLVEQGRRIAGVAVSVLFREDGAAETKVSFRSTSGTDVNALAAQLGGGGHVNASGATLALPLAEAIERVLPAARAVAGRAEAPSGRRGP